jgi:hypothetical protein
MCLVAHRTNSLLVFRWCLHAVAEFIRSVYDSRWIRGHKRNAKA